MVAAGGGAGPARQFCPSTEEAPCSAAVIAWVQKVAVALLWGLSLSACGDREGHVVTGYSCNQAIGGVGCALLTTKPGPPVRARAPLPNTGKGRVLGQSRYWAIENAASEGTRWSG